MNEEQVNIKLNLLDQVERVEVSPFLKTRIDQAVANQYEGTVKGKWAMSLLACFAMILVVNIVAIKSSQQNTNSELSISDYGLEENVNLYLYE